MASAPAKFCLDLNRIRWSYMNGTITRKTNNDDPLAGQEVPAKQVTAIEQTTIKKVERKPMGRYVIVVGVALVVAAWMSGSTVTRGLLGLVGLLAMYRGVEMSRAKVTILDAYRLVIPGRNQEDWQLVGNTPEVHGFLEAVRSEMRG